MRLINFLFFLVAPALVVAQKNFASDSLYVVQGKSDYEGKKDLSAKVKIFSTGDKIIVEAEVIDDRVIINPDSVNCDHVEIWYSLTDGVEEKLSNTSIPLYHYYYDTTTKENSRWRFYLFDKDVEAGEFSAKRFKNDCMFYGQVHYGLFPDNRKVYWYDKKCYSLLQSALGEKPGHLDQGVKYKAEKTKGGYKISASITPLGLGFISVPSMSRIKMKVNVIDVDEAGNKTILSTSSLHKLENSNALDSVLFSKPLKTNVTSVPAFIFDSLKFTPIVMFTEKGTWSSITRRSACENDSCSISEICFFRTPFGYKKMRLNKEEIDKLSRTIIEKKSDSSYKERMEENYFINNKVYSSIHSLYERNSKFRDLKKEFLYIDGAVGLLFINNKENIECNEVSVQMNLVWIKGEESKNVLLLNQGVCNDTTVIGKYAVSNLVIEKVYWIKEGSVLMIEGNVPAVGIRKFKVGLGAGGKINIGEVKK